MTPTTRNDLLDARIELALVLQAWTDIEVQYPLDSPDWQQLDDIDSTMEEAKSMMAWLRSIVARNKAQGDLTRLADDMAKDIQLLRATLQRCRGRCRGQG